MSLNELFEKYRRNPCESLLSEILKDSQFLVYGIVVNIVKHNQDAEDLTQDILIKVIQNINLLPQNTYFIPWLNRISLNAAIDLYQQKKRIKSSIPHLSNFQETQKPEIKNDNDETISILYQHLSKLDDNDQSMIINKHIHQMTYAQLGNLYQLPISTIQTKIETILKKLKTSIEKAGFAGVALGLASAFDQIKTPPMGLDFLPKLKGYFTITYPKAKPHLLSGKTSTKSLVSALKGKILLFSISISCLLIFTGLFFAFNEIASDINSENDKAQVTQSSSISNLDNPKNKLIPNANHQSLEIPRSNQLVVDQTLFSTNNKDEKSQLVNEVLGAEMKKVEIEITLVDGEQNKNLIDYEVEFNFDSTKTSTKTEKYKTDKNGKFIFTTNQVQIQGAKVWIQILTKDYITKKIDFPMTYRQTELKVKLYRGGSLEIRATNDENEVVDGLVVAGVGNGLLPIFDADRGIYVLSNIPIGTYWPLFTATGCQQTPAFRIKIESKKNTFVEVKMQLARKIYFDLDVEPKPEKIKIQHTDVVKNQSNLYEYVFDDGKTFRSSTGEHVCVSADKYVPKYIYIEPKIATYKVKLDEGFTGKLQINNKEGKSISGAKIIFDFTLTHRNNQVIETGEDGIAILTGLGDNTKINFLVSHIDFGESYVEWAFNATDQHSKTIVLSEKKGCLGNIKFGEKRVMGAKVVLIRNDGYDSPIQTMNTDEDGSYHFNLSNSVKIEQEYILKAFHQDYGVAVSPVFKFETSQKVIDLTLVPEKSLAFKLVDNTTGVVLTNKTIEFHHGNDSSIGYSFKTDGKGECEGFNLIHGVYYVKFDEDKLKLGGDKFNQINIQIPKNNLVLTATPKLYKKIVVTTSSGIPYMGSLMVKDGAGRNQINVINGADGSCYFEFYDENQPLNGALIFEAEGYAITNVAVGKNDKAKDLPNELKVELALGDNIKIKVLDNNNNPIPFALVDVNLSDNSLYQSNQTNNLGEVLFMHLIGKFNISVKIDGYATYKTEIDVSQTKEILVKLCKGGGLKGQLTFDKEVTSARIYLKNNDKLWPGYFDESLGFNQDSNFEFFNLAPGEYSIRIIEKFKDGKQATKIIPKIIIEDEKILEIDLDENLKK